MKIVKKKKCNAEFYKKFILKYENVEQLGQVART